MALTCQSVRLMVRLRVKLELESVKMCILNVSCVCERVCIYVSVVKGGRVLLPCPIVQDNILNLLYLYHLSSSMKHL